MVSPDEIMGLSLVWARSRQDRSPRGGRRPAALAAARRRCVRLLHADFLTKVSAHIPDAHEKTAVVRKNSTRRSLYASQPLI